MNNDELKHYGVLGMKWGHRKGYSESSQTDNSNKKPHYTARRVGIVAKGIISRMAFREVNKLVTASLLKSGHMATAKYANMGIKALTIASGVNTVGKLREVRREKKQYENQK